MLLALLVGQFVATTLIILAVLILHEVIQFGLSERQWFLVEKPQPAHIVVVLAQINHFVP